jgi:hypothetical protein
MAESGAEVVVSSAGEFTQFFQSEVDLYRKLAQKAQIRLD